MIEPNAQRTISWEPAEVRLDEPTRTSRLPWVIGIDAALPAGVAVNAAACLAASAGATVTGLLGPGGPDADGASAQTNRVYADYLTELAATTGSGLDLRAVSLLGPKNKVDRLTKRLGLLP